MKKLIFIIITILINVLVTTTTYISIHKADKQSSAIVERYESNLDDMQIDFDDTEHYTYDVFVNNKHYYVKPENVTYIPYHTSEYTLIVKGSGTCNLYVFFKSELWEA
jgi:flagellar basal body-associated protein FliL